MYTIVHTTQLILIFSSSSQKYKFPDGIIIRLDDHNSSGDTCNFVKVLTEKNLEV